MTKFVCSKCNYRFEADAIMDCPYCGDRKSLQKEKSASELIDEVGELLEG